MKVLRVSSLLATIYCLQEALAQQQSYIDSSDDTYDDDDDEYEDDRDDGIEDVPEPFETENADEGQEEGEAIPAEVTQLDYHVSFIWLTNYCR